MYICSTVNKTCCDECPHSQPHEPIDAKFTYKEGKRISIGKCTEKGVCYEGSNNRWECKCICVEEIDIMSMMAIGRKYGVTNATIRKWSKQYGII